MNYSCISADCHIDLIWLPPDLFTANASLDMKERMPYVAETPDGPVWTTRRGVRFGLACGVGSIGRKYVKGQLGEGPDRMAAEGLYDQASAQSRRVTDPKQRLRDQDRDGVEAEVLYGVLGSLERIQDPQAATEMASIYNDWLTEFCSNAPERLAGLAVIPSSDVETAVREIRRVAKLGLRGLEISCSHDMVPFFDRRWDALWQAVDATRLPVHLHSIAPKSQVAPDWSHEESWAAHGTAATCFQLQSATYLSGMILGGVLERHPNMRLVLGESGLGWIPYVLERMDFEWEHQLKSNIKLSMKPSEYWRQRCKATFQFDEVGVRLIDLLGEETLMWGSDFPHPDGIWPDSQRYIERQFGRLPGPVKRKIICDNALALYGLQSGSR